MDRPKLLQVPLVSADGKAQPAFPGGWAKAIFDAVHTFAPEYTVKQSLPGSRRTQVRIKGGQPIAPGTYGDIEASLVALVISTFPTVGAIKGFAAKYVNEYFRLWKDAAEMAPRWAKIRGFEPEMTGVLSRALVRDLVLRCCYLETCERALRKETFTADELAWLGYDSPSQVYATIISELQRKHGLSIEGLAARMEGNKGLGYEKALYRFKSGAASPHLAMLRKLWGRKNHFRVLAGVGFLDELTRKVRLRQSVVGMECLRATEAFLVHHPRTGLTKKLAAKGDYLLLHTGLASIWPKMPDALWQAHLYTLQCARVPDLAQAYLQFSEPDNDRALTHFLATASHDSSGSAHNWMNKIREHNNVMPFPH